MKALDFVFRLFDRISGPANKINASLNKVNAAMGRTRNAANPLKQFDRSVATSAGNTQQAAGVMTTALGTFAGGALLSAAKGAASMTAAGGTWLLSSLAFRENTIGSLSAMLKSKQAAEAVFNDAVKFAAKTPFSTSQVAGAFEKLVAAGFKVTELRDVMTDLGDFARGDMEKLQRSLLAISQIRSAGKLQGDELMQLAEAGLPVGKVYDMLAQKLGKTTDEVRRLQEAGKLKAEPAIDAIRAVMKDQFGGQMEGASTSLAGLWSTLKSVPEDILFAPALARSMEPAIAGMKTFLRVLTAAMAPDTAGGKLLASVFQGAGDALGWIAGKLATIDFGAWFKRVGALAADVLPKVGKFFEGIGKSINFDTLAAMAGRLFAVLEKHLGGMDGDAFMKIGTAVGFVIEKLLTFSITMIDLAMTVGDAVKWMLAPIIKIGSDVAQLVDLVTAKFGTLPTSLQSIGAAAMDGLKAGLLGPVPGILRDVGALFDAITGTGKGKLKIASPSKVFEEIGRFTGEGFILGLTNSGVTKAMADAFKIPDVAAPKVPGAPASSTIQKLTLPLAATTPFNLPGLAASLLAGVPGAPATTAKPDVGVLDRILASMAPESATSQMKATADTAIRPAGGAAPMVAAAPVAAPVTVTLNATVTNHITAENGEQAAKETSASFTAQLGAALKKLGSEAGR